MLIRELLNKYIEQGHGYRDSQNLAAEEIVLTKIASSPLSQHVTLKGGIVMFNITKSDRRVTQDIDFDFIRYSIDDRSIRLFVKKMNTINDGITASVEGGIEQLHQEDYQGARVHLLLTDIKKSTLRIKLDIGVHTYTAIQQKSVIFAFDNVNNSVSIKVNPCEQIFAEKLLSLARLGPISTRYKDIYDLYYLAADNLVDIDKTRDILEIFFECSKKKPNDVYDLVNAVIDALEDSNFSKEAGQPASKWIDVDYDDLKTTIVDFISKL